MDIHLGKSRDQGLFRALVAFEELRGEAAVSVAGDTQLEFADAGHKRAGVVAGTIAQAALGALTGFGTDGVGHLRLKNLLHGFAHDLAQKFLILRDERFKVGSC